MSVDNAFTNSLKEAAGDQWNRIVNHKFTTEIGNGSIDRDGKEHFDLTLKEKAYYGSEQNQDVST